MTEQLPAPESRPTGERRSGAGTAVLGAILVVVGIVFFVGQQLDLDWGGEIWPFYVIAAGVVLAVFGLAQAGAAGLTIAGSIVTMVGLVLLYQAWFDHYESWAYAWPLVAPGGSGVGMLLHGTRFGNGKMVRDGLGQILVAAGIFVVGFVFFEGLIGISGNRWNLAEWVLPAVIIGFGLIVLVRAFTSGRSADEAHRADHSSS
jgi:hypothetical protein